MAYRQYTDKEKIAYYKKKAAMAAKGYSAPKKAAYTRTVSGQGAYSTAPRRQYRRRQKTANPLKYAPQIGGVLGGAVGGVFGQPGVGAALGSGAGAILNSIFGKGSYTVKRNTVLYPEQVPIFNSNGVEGCIRMQHKEYIQDIVSSITPGAFQVQSFKIDPADSTTFPFLSQIATNFEEFRINGMIFYFKTTSGNISSTQALGNVIMATAYDSNFNGYNNKQEMLAATFSTSVVASQSTMHPIECDPEQTPSRGLFFTKIPGISPINADSRWSNLGLFNIATQGVDGAEINLGELHVSYDVTLCKPRLVSDSVAQADHYQLGAGINTVTPLYLTGSLTPESDGFTEIGDTQILFDSSFNGNVVVQYTLFGSTGAWISPAISAGTGASDLLILNNDTDNDLQYTFAAAERGVTTIAYFTIKSAPAGSGLGPGVGAALNFSGGTFFTPTNGDLLIMQLPSDFL